MRDQNLEKPRFVANSEYHKIKHQWLEVIAYPKLFSFDSYGLFSSILDCMYSLHLVSEHRILPLPWYYFAPET